MKLTNVSIFDDFKEFEYITDDEIRVTVIVRNNGDKSIRIDDEVSIDDIKEIIEIIESGKVEIEL